MGTMWMLYLLAVACSRLGYGFPLGTPPISYPQDEANRISGWSADQGWLVAIPALALIFAAGGLLFGCLWCYRHKDCKTDRGNDNQLFASSSSQLQDARRVQPPPPDSDFSEPVNNNVNEDNNNGPISLREMQNIANNNAVAYIVSENEERNRAASRESVVEFEPLPVVVGPLLDPLEGCADWFGDEDFPRDRLQYLREIGRGWFGRVVEGEVETPEGGQSPVAVKILNQNASLEEKAQFLRENTAYRALRHENILAYVASCLHEDPFVLIFELCPMTLKQYLIANRSKMVELTEAGVPLRLVCDVTSALSHMHGRGLYYGDVVASNVLVRGDGEAARCVLGRYVDSRQRTPQATVNVNVNASTDVCSLGVLLWEVSSWGEQPTQPPLAEPTLPTPYRSHMYQVMQLCWNPNQESRPTSSQVHALVNHLYTTHLRLTESPQDDGYSSCDFEDRWQRLKPNHIPVVDEHVAIVHAPSTSMVSHFTNSEEFASQTLSVDMDTAVSRSSSIMSDNLLSVQAKSESLNNLHGSYEDVRNNYHSNNGQSLYKESRAESNVSDASVDPWLKDIIAGSQDDVSYYKDVSDVIKNLDNILNSEKTSSSESSHQASPSRDNLSLDCKREVAAPSSLVKSPGIRNFQNILEMGAEEVELGDEGDRDTIGTLSHSFERHSDTTSQNTLANLTPDTPTRELGEEKVPDEIPIQIVQQHMPNNVVENSCRLKSMDVDVGSVSVYEQSELSEDCQLTSEVVGAESAPAKSIDETLRELDMKLVDNARSLETSGDIDNLEINRNIINATTHFLANEINVHRLHDNERQSQNDTKMVRNNVFVEEIEPVFVDNFHSNATEIPEEIIEIVDLKPQPDSITDITSLPDFSESKVTENSAANEKDETAEDIKPADNEKVSEIKFASEELVNEVIERALDALSSETLYANLIGDEESTFHDIKEDTYQNITQGHESLSQIETLPLENCDKNQIKLDDADVTISESFGERSLDTASTLPIGNIPDIVQNVDVTAAEHKNTVVKEDSLIKDANTTNDSTMYMDLINASGSVIKKDETLDNNIKQFIKTCVSETNTTADNDYTLVRNESTVYLDLPSNLINDTHEFLHVEKLAAECDLKDGNINESFPTSTPNANEGNGKNTTKSDDSGRCTPDLGPGVTLTKIEFKTVPENLSPLDSPSKSHPTDTYDENSSVLLGPFENCSLELFKPVKSMPDLQLPREELLAFSSNFSDINLETPSPLRDVNFLNEVPDILSEDLKSEVQTVSLTEEEKELNESKPKAGPSTPPNSPGNFQDHAQKYAPEIAVASHSSYNRAAHYSLDYDNEIELNQIELQLTSKLAMAENENNMNIEYSGPLTVEGLVRDDFVQEAYLAGNGQEAVSQESRPVFALDESCVAALRNELELKLPLAQVASIEPPDDDDDDDPEEEEVGEVGFCAPELIVTYAGVLSPIAEETGRQLSAYENDLLWTASHATDSSESYLEPCNNSTDEVTDLPTGLQSGVLEHSTYTVEEPASPMHDTYTVNKDSTSKEGTMSTDSLNVIIQDTEPDSPKSPIDDQTYTKLDDKDHISQVSPFLVSPTTDTSTPHTENVTGVSTLSKATVPTDVKALKQSESLNLSKATSIDSWCSNDTLFNVEDDFEDLALEGEADNDKSDDSNTLNYQNNQFNDSTYNVPDDRSPDSCSQDSLTANCTYNKLKTEETSPIAVTSSDINGSSPKDTQTRDLAYGTLMSGLASYSSCTNDLISANNELWRLPQPELVRRSPLPDDTVNLTPPSGTELCESKNELMPNLNHEPCFKKLDSIDVSCFDDNHEESNLTQPSANVTDKRDSPGYHYKHMAQSIHSTPLIEIICYDSAENTGIEPENLQESQQSLVLAQMPTFQNFVNSAELRPQERSSVNVTSTNASNTEMLLEGESNFAITVSQQIPNYASFEASAGDRPQEVNSKTSQSINSDDFRNFESSVQERPQDLSSIVESSAFLLKSECKSSEIAAANIETDVSIDNTDGHLVIDEGRITNLEEESQLNIDSLHYVAPVLMPFIEETEQPHSIIMTIDDTVPQINEENKTFDSHESQKLEHDLYDSHRKEINGDVTINNDLTQETAVKEPELVETVNIALENTVSNGFSNDSSDNKENFATLSFLSQPYEEISGNDSSKSKNEDIATKSSQESENIVNNQENVKSERTVLENGNGEVVGKMANVTEDFLSNEKQYSGFMSYDALLSDIRFTGPSSDMMSTSFCGESPSEPTAPPAGESEKLNGTVENIVKEWDSDSEDTQSSNSSSCEFVWRDGDGHERPLLPTTMFQHQRNNNVSHNHAYHPTEHEDRTSSRTEAPGSEGAGSGDSGSGSEGDEVAFKPSSWSSEKAPAKSSLRRMENLQSLSSEAKKRVVFKRQKYHSVYEYPREVVDPDLVVAPPEEDSDSGPFEPFSEWTTLSEEESNCGQLYSSHPLDLHKLHAGVSITAPYDDDFYISSSARPFESFGIISSEFFPGMHLKSPLLDHVDHSEDYPAPPSPLTPAPELPTRTPSADFTTPDSGVEDITPVSTSTEEDFKKKLEDPTQTQCWKADSASSSESVSPSSPGGEALGGLRHTRDKLKLDLPPSPHIPSPRHNRVFNFVLDKPKRRHPSDDAERPQTTTPIIITDDTPLLINAIPVDIDTTPAAEPTFSTFGKEPEKTEDGELKVVLKKVETEDGELKIVLKKEETEDGKLKVVLKKEETEDGKLKVVLNEEETEDGKLKVVLKEEETEDGKLKVVLKEVVKAEANEVKVETVKGEGTVLDSGDEDSGIESSAKTSLERKARNVS